MAKWQGTVVPNTGYVEKVYFNINLSNEEIKNIFETLTYIQTPLVEFPIYPMLCSNDGSSILFVTNYVGSAGDIYYDIYFYNINTAEYRKISNMNYLNNNLIYDWYETECNINKEVTNNFSGLLVGTENNLLTSLFSITPFIQSQPTTADKLQKLIDGKQYVIDKTNAKAGTSLNIKSKWEDIGDVIEGIESGGVSNKVYADGVEVYGYDENGNKYLVLYEEVA